MVNVHRGEVSIVLDNRKYVMVPSFSVLINIEEELGYSIMDLVSKISRNHHLNLREIEAILRYSIQDLEYQTLQEVIYKTGLVTILPSVIKFIDNAIGGHQ